MRFDHDFIEKVRTATNLVDVISQHVELKRSGSGFIGLCPFHGEKSPSFSVSEDKQVYHCFGCQASGDVFNFIEQNQGLTFPETVEYLASRAGLPIPESAKPFGDSEQKKKSSLFAVNALAAKFFQNELTRQPAEHPAWRYLESRGISPEFASANGLGYAPDAWGALTQLLENKRIPLALASTLGLVRARSNGKQGYYDLFRNRIIFPIFSPTDQCLGFGGRVLDSSMPKYLNSPDSPVFHKGQVFYGLQRAAKFIRSSDTAILVEGYTDWLALEKAGIHNVVATLGTALTEAHARLLSRYCQNVIVLFDGDEAGRMAARRSLAILLTEGLYPKGITLPDELDPDEFIGQQGAATLKAALQQAHDLYDIVLAEEARGHTGEPSDKVQILDRLGPILATVKDPRLRSLYVENTVSHLNVEARLVRSSITPNRRPEPTEAPKTHGIAQPPERTATIELIRPPRLELDLLNVALMKETHFKRVMDSQIVPSLSHAGIRQVFELAADTYGQGLCNFDNLTTLLVARVRPADMVTRQLVEPLRSLTDEAAEKFIHDCLRRIHENSRKLQAKALMSDLRGAQGEKRTEKMEQFMNVQRSGRQSSERK